MPLLTLTLKRMLIPQQVRRQQGKINNIKPNPDQPRRDFDKKSLEELSLSIKNKGVITPITLRKSGKDYEIVAGERRWRAAKKANLKSIPAYIINKE